MRSLQIAGLLLISAAALGGLGVWTTYPGYWPFAAADRAQVAASVSGNQFHIDSLYLRTPDQMRGGDLRQIDLVAHFPDFRPGSRQTPRPGQAMQSPQEVVVTILPPDGAVEPAERPSKLYARFLEPDAWSHPGGLVMRRFEDGSPYEREELYIAPPEGRTFYARCMRPIQPLDGLPESCISEFRQGGLDIRVRFSPELLPQWSQLTEGVKGLVRSLAR